MSHTVKLAGQKLKFVYVDGPNRVRLVFEHGAIVISSDSPISVGVESTSDDVAAEVDISLPDGKGCYTQSEEGGGGENKPETLTAEEKNILEQFRRGGFPFVRDSLAAPP